MVYFHILMNRALHATLHSVAPSVALSIYIYLKYIYTLHRRRCITMEWNGRQESGTEKRRHYERN